LTLVKETNILIDKSVSAEKSISCGFSWVVYWGSICRRKPGYGQENSLNTDLLFLGEFVHICCGYNFHADPKILSK